MFNIRTIVIGTTFVISLSKLYLNYRQIRQCHNSKDNVPKESKSTLGQHQDAINYELDKRYFDYIIIIYETVIAIIGLLYLDPYFWHLSGTYAQNEFYRTLLFFALQQPLDIIDTFTIKLYKTFVIEEKHGFNKMSFKLFVTDVLKSYFLTVVIGCPLVWLVLKVVEYFGDQLYIYLTVVLVVIMFTMMIIAPILIFPMFYKLEPLKDEDLRIKIEALASREDVNFPLKKLEQMDGSTRSSHSNAFMYGFWKFKRIVLFDTILEQPHSEIEAVLAHEIGHWAMNHNIMQQILTIFMTVIVLYGYKSIRGNNAIYQIFGYDTINDYVGFFPSFSIYSSILQVTGVVYARIITNLTRLFEYQADAYAYKLGGEKMATNLMKALDSLTVDNKSFENPDSLYSWWYYSHPTTIERKNALKELIQKHK